MFLLVSSYGLQDEEVRNQCWIQQKTLLLIQYQLCNTQMDNNLIKNKIILLCISLITGDRSKMASFYYLPTAKNLMLAGTNC